MNVEYHVTSAFNTAFIQKEPFTHVYIQNVFPWDFYANLVQTLPGEYTDKSYENRMMCEVSNPALKWMLGDAFKQTIQSRMGLEGNYYPYIRFVRDTADYSIKVHTDIKKKAITLLFYLPGDLSTLNYGTSVYVPKEKGFESDGTKRFEFELFEKVYTAPFMPNSVFGFKRANNSFHGVERQGSGIRNVLLYNLMQA
jgi:hypothetical protein